jgi:hypothetical protein
MAPEGPTLSSRRFQPAGNEAEGVAPTPTGLTHSPAPTGAGALFRFLPVGFIPQARDYSSFAPPGQFLPSRPSRSLTCLCYPTEHRKSPFGASTISVATEPESF